MITLATTHWVGQLLRKLPAPLIAALDAWAFRQARQRAEARRERVLRSRKPAAAAPAPASYTPRPWRD
jgi:hypothetical protein